MREEAVKGPMDLAKGGKSSNKEDNSSKCIVDLSIWVRSGENEGGGSKGSHGSG